MVRAAERALRCSAVGLEHCEHAQKRDKATSSIPGTQNRQDELAGRQKLIFSAQRRAVLRLSAQAPPEIRALKGVQAISSKLWAA